VGAVAGLGPDEHFYLLRWLCRASEAEGFCRALTAAAPVLAACATPHSWEYRTRTTKVRIGKAVLDGYGKSGWELVSFTCIPADRSGTNFEYEYIFKRPVK